MFYKREDWSAIAAEATNPGLTPQERQYANKLWQGGVNGWASAPEAADQFKCVTVPGPNPPVVGAGVVVTQNPDGSFKVCDPDIRMIVCSGTGVTKQATVDWLRLIGNKYPGALYMLAIADDIANTAVEPWP